MASLDKKSVITVTGGGLGYLRRIREISHRVWTGYRLVNGTRRIS